MAHNSQLEYLGKLGHTLRNANETRHDAPRGMIRKRAYPLSPQLQDGIYRELLMTLIEDLLEDQDGMEAFDQRLNLARQALWRGEGSDLGPIALHALDVARFLDNRWIGVARAFDADCRPIGAVPSTKLLRAALFSAIADGGLFQKLGIEEETPQQHLEAVAHG